MNLANQSPSTSMSKQYMSIASILGVIKGNRFLAQVLQPNHMFPILLMQIFEGKTNAY